MVAYQPGKALVPLASLHFLSALPKQLVPPCSYIPSLHLRYAFTVLRQLFAIIRWIIITLGIQHD
jgi:hypothetical protein